MLKIYVNGGLLDMPTNTSLTYKSDSILFEDEITRGEYSYPFTFPLTENNRKLLGNIQEMHKIDEAFKVEVDWFFLGTLRPGMLYIDRISFDFTSGAGTCEGNLVGMEGLFYSLIADKQIRDVDLGANYTIPNYTIDTWPGTGSGPSVVQYAKDITTGVVTGMPFVFPMVGCTSVVDGKKYAAIINPLLTAAPNMLALQYGCINFWAIELAAYPVYYQSHDIFERPFQDASSVGVSNKMVPMFFNYWILNQVFSALGYELDGDIYNDADFRKTIFINNYSISRWRAVNGSIGQLIDDCTEIDPHDHVGTMLVEDYLNDLCKIFCATFEFDLRFKKVYFNRKDTYLNADTALEIKNAEVSPVVLKGNSNAKGLSLSYRFPNDDFVGGYLNEAVTDGPITGEVDFYADLAALSVPVGSIYYVRARNTFYHQTKANVWAGSGYNLNDFVMDGAKQVNINFCPAANYDFQPEFLSTTDRYMSIPVISDMISMRSHAFIPTSPPGSLVIYYLTYTDDVIYPCTPKIVYWHGYQKTSDGAYSYPYASASNYSRDETTITKLAEYSLGFHGTEGLANTYYKHWMAFMTSKIKYTFTLLTAEIKLKSLTLYQKVSILGQTFLLRSTKQKVPYKGTVEAEGFKL